MKPEGNGQPKRKGGAESGNHERTGSAEARE